MPSPSYHKSPYPIQHAFVVQLAADTALDSKGMTGRVEHVASGQTARFESMDALQVFVAQVLGALASPSGGERQLPEMVENSRRPGTESDSVPSVNLNFS